MSLQSMEWQAWVWQNIPSSSVVMCLGWHPWRCHSLPISLIVGSSRRFLPGPFFFFPVCSGTFRSGCLSVARLPSLCNIRDLCTILHMPHCGGGSGNFESFFKVYLTRHCTYSLYTGCFRVTVHGVRKRAREDIE